ncbi:hypothetical protein NF212_05955 [Parasalinivibrio latis]|uniref:hypothetical protein n=1 Tax=Parasalinivibrio latis TaxID=2952610 RepID=UPI0030DE55EA
MKSAKEFAAWLMDRFASYNGVYLTRSDITELTSRQSLRSDFVRDVHNELMHFGRGLIADMRNDKYYMVTLGSTHWKDVGDFYSEGKGRNEDTHSPVTIAPSAEGGQIRSLASGRGR